MNESYAMDTPTRDQVRRALRYLTRNLSPDDAGVRRMLGYLDTLREQITDEAAEALRSYLAEAGARAVIEDVNGPGETARLLGRYAAWLHGTSDSPKADRTQDAQEAIETLADAPLADAQEATLDPPDAPQAEEESAHALVSVREACAGHPSEERGRHGEGHPGETGVCRQCGALFKVNHRHVEVHRFCSAACRSKARHRLKRTRATDESLEPDPWKARPMEISETSSA